MRIHGTAIAYENTGVLIRGESGSGKSTLAAWLLRSARNQGKNCALVADDIVILARDGDSIVVSAPTETEGMIELRGFGPIEVAIVKSTKLQCVIDLVDNSKLERLPDDCELKVELLGVPIRRQPVPDNSFERMVLLTENTIANIPRIC